MTGGNAASSVDAAARPSVRQVDGVWTVRTGRGDFPAGSWRHAHRFALLWADLHAAGIRS